VIARASDLESPLQTFMCFRIALLHSTTYLRALCDNPSANIAVCGDFNVHNYEWLGSTKTDNTGLEAFNFSVSQNISLTFFFDFDFSTFLLVFLTMIHIPLRFSICSLFLIPVVVKPHVNHLSEILMML